MSKIHDALYYYFADGIRSEWRRVDDTFESEWVFERHEERLRKMGFETRRGRKSIGPPEGPPRR